MAYVACLPETVDITAAREAVLAFSSIRNSDFSAFLSSRCVLIMGSRIASKHDLSGQAALYWRIST